MTGRGRGRDGEGVVEFAYRSHDSRLPVKLRLDQSEDREIV